MTPSSSAAFFDLDRTIIGGSSVFTFGLVAYRNGYIPTKQLAVDAFNATTFKISGASDEKTEAVKNRILDSIKGAQVSDLTDLSDQIIPKLMDDVRKEARELIDLHQKAGRDTYIISASPVEIVSHLAEELGMTGGLGTVSEHADGVYTGRLAQPFCYGEGKADAIRRIAEELGYNLEASYAYTDSAGDLPMLDVVGHPVAVNPDSALRSISYHRGWPIVRFSRTRKRIVRRTTTVSSAVILAGATYALGRRQGRRAAG